MAAVCDTQAVVLPRATIEASDRGHPTSLLPTQVGGTSQIYICQRTCALTLGDEDKGILLPFSQDT